MRCDRRRAQARPAGHRRRLSGRRVVQRRAHSLVLVYPVVLIDDPMAVSENHLARPLSLGVLRMPPLSMRAGFFG
jgi:hypothetical protein